MIERVEWWLFWGVGPLLWASGIWLFVHSPLSRARKIGWAALLVAIGLGIGALLSLPQIRDRFLILLVALPVLALVDVWLARSNRSFAFWVRACAFEICTVFGCAALARLALDQLLTRR